MIISNKNPSNTTNTNINKNNINHNNNLNNNKNRVMIDVRRCAPNPEKPTHPQGRTKRQHESS